MGVAHYAAFLTIPLIVIGMLLPFYAHINAPKPPINASITDIPTKIPICTADGIVYIDIADLDKVPKSHVPHCPMCVLSSLSHLLPPPTDNLIAIDVPDHSAPAFYVETAAPPIHVVFTTPAVPRGPPVLI